MPDSLLKPIGGGYRLHRDAADQFLKLSDAFKQRFGKPLTPSDGYRTIAQQQVIKDKYPDAGATVGFSPHGWGGAADLLEIALQVNQVIKEMGLPMIDSSRVRADVNAKVRANSLEYNWLAVNGPKFGWFNPTRLALPVGKAGKQSEAWHWEYWGFQTGVDPNPTIAEPVKIDPKSTEGAGTTTTVTTQQKNDVEACYAAISNLELVEGTTQVGDPAMGTVRFEPKDIDKKLSKETDVSKKAQLICNYCNQRKQSKSQNSSWAATLKKANAARNLAKRDFFHLAGIFRYLELYKEYMVGAITSDADGIKSNAFGAAPGSLSIGGDIVMPGINGLRIGELFWIERVPAFYRVFGAFQILSVEDNIDINGWKTKVHARFNYLGKAWQRVMIEKLK